MKKQLTQTVQLVEVPNEGLVSLMGQIITVFCARYIYTGLLAGVNDSCILLENPKIVYETGSFSSKDWKDAQDLPHSFYINTAAIESFGLMK